jgi:hypothetical protein
VFRGGSSGLREVLGQLGLFGGGLGDLEAGGGGVARGLQEGAGVDRADMACDDRGCAEDGIELHGTFRSSPKAM